MFYVYIFTDSASYYLELHGSQINSTCKKPASRKQALFALCLEYSVNLNGGTMFPQTVNELLRGYKS
jgi:hypothetical protein